MPHLFSKLSDAVTVGAGCLAHRLESFGPVVLLSSVIAFYI